jgi:hypothetical protein
VTVFRRPGPGVPGVAVKDSSTAKDSVAGVSM